MAGHFKDPVKRFNRNIKIDGNGCWIWQAAIATPQGYGHFTVLGRMVYAHRWAYEHFKGVIPEGYQIDHLCRVRACVNPDHLEAVTPKVNNLRSESMAAKYAKSTHCKNGHPYIEGNFYRRKNGSRQCKPCCYERLEKYRQSPEYRARSNSLRRAKYYQKKGEVA